MSEDPRDPEPTPGEPHPTDPATETEVRRLLAEARHDEPAPAAVVERLDRVLAQLREGDESPATATVTDLAVRRRRRAGRLLLAAAAVVVAGVGVGQVLGTGSDDSGASTAADSSADGSTAGGRSQAEDTDGGSEGGSDGAGGGQGPEAAASPEGSLRADGYALAGVAPVRIRPDHFSADVNRAVRRARAASADTATGSQEPQATPAPFDCAPATYGEGTLLPVVYDGTPAVLALRPLTGDTQVAELLQCGSDVVVRSVTIAQP